MLNYICEKKKYLINQILLYFNYKLNYKWINIEKNIKNVIMVVVLINLYKKVW
jgi:hypothetical protein